MGGIVVARPFRAPESGDHRMRPTPLYAHEPLWIAVYGGSFLAFMMVEFWVFSRERRGAKGTSRDKGSLQFIMLAMGIGLWTALGLPYAISAPLPFEEEPTFWTAIGVLWAGILFRFWSIVTLGRFFRISVLLQEDHRLITTGPYRFIRNPSYTGGILIITGVALAQGNYWSLLSAIGGTLIAYAWRVRVEEAALREHFGEAYAAYARRTWSILPPIW